MWNAFECSAKFHANEIFQRMRYFRNWMGLCRLYRIVSFLGLCYSFGITVLIFSCDRWGESNRSKSSKWCNVQEKAHISMKTVVINALLFRHITAPSCMKQKSRNSLRRHRARTLASLLKVLYAHKVWVWMTTRISMYEDFPMEFKNKYYKQNCISWASSEAKSKFMNHISQIVWHEQYLLRCIVIHFQWYQYSICPNLILYFTVCCFYTLDGISMHTASSESKSFGVFRLWFLNNTRLFIESWNRLIYQIQSLISPYNM